MLYALSYGEELELLALNLEDESVETLTDVRRADGLALRLRAGDDDQLDARLGQNRRKRLVIQVRCVGERLLADVAPRQIQRGRNAGEERRVQLGVGAGDNVRIL